MRMRINFKTRSKQELLDQNTDFDGTLYIDGDWIKKDGNISLEL